MKPSGRPIRFIRYGVTGVDAAFASTGSMLMISGPGKSRVASLLPYYHIGLDPVQPAVPDGRSLVGPTAGGGDAAGRLCATRPT